MGYERTLGESTDGLGFVVSIVFAAPLIYRHHLLRRADPHSSLMVEFGCKEDAIIYCERMGSLTAYLCLSLASRVQYDIVEPPTHVNFKKAYGANFSSNKKTRVATK